MGLDFFKYCLGFNNYKFMSVGDTNHLSYGAYGPGNNFRRQSNFRNFWWTVLNLTASSNDTGMLVNEGVTYNWLRRQYVFCGGQQVTKVHFSWSHLGPRHTRYFDTQYYYKKIILSHGFLLTKVSS